MKNLSHFTPFFLLVFLISIIGISTYKINAKQQIKQESSIEEDVIETSFFEKEDILLPEFTLPNLHNQNDVFSKQDLLGQYSVINFFASWCTTCRAEHDDLMRLKDEGIIDIYGVAWRDINDNTKVYLEENGNPFVKTASDGKALFTKIIGIKAVPETLIVNPEGRVVLRYRGNLDDFTINEIRRFVATKK